MVLELKNCEESDLVYIMMEKKKKDKNDDDNEDGDEDIWGEERRKGFEN